MRTKILEIERTKNGEYLWRYKAANGHKIAWSGETYVDKAQAFTMSQTGSPVVQIQNALFLGEKDEVKAWIYNPDTDELEEIKAKFIDNFEDGYTEPHEEGGD
jgi:hypothetical protein